MDRGTAARKSQSGSFVYPDFVINMLRGVYVLGKARPSITLRELLDCRARRGES